MDELKTFYKILDEICNEKNISQKLLSYGWIRELKKENKIHHMMGYQFDLNSSNACRIVKDKYATYAILKENNIPIIEHKMIFNPFTRIDYSNENYMDDVKNMLEKNNYKIVIKANDSLQGKDVYCCLSEIEAQNIINKLFAESKDSVSVCPYVEIDYEYRVIILDGQVIYVYKKKKPYVIGDGIHTVQELIFSKYGNQIKISLSDDLDLNKIADNGEEITISWKHNLNNGAEPILVYEDEKIEQIKDIAICAGKTVGINFATVDIALTSKNELTVVEINGNVCMNKFAELIPKGYEISKEIYAKAIDKMFEIEEKEHI